MFIMNVKNVEVNLFTQICEAREATLAILNAILKSCKKLEDLGFRTDGFRLEVLLKHDELNQLYPALEL